MLSRDETALVRRHAGEVASATALGRRTVGLTLRDGRRAVLARTDGADKHRREVDAYRAGAGAVTIPALLAESAKAQAILLSYVPGDPVLEPAASDLEAAGRALAALHARPHVDDDPLPLDRALTARARRVSAEVRAGAPVDVAAALAILGAARATVTTARRVLCHRDFMPYNWRWTPDGRFAVLDFEHARPDHWLGDVARLAPRLLAVAGGWDAFWRGYGRIPDVAETRLLGALATLDAARTWAWAQRHPEADDAARIHGGVEPEPALAALRAGAVSSRRRA